MAHTEASQAPVGASSQPEVAVPVVAEDKSAPATVDGIGPALPNTLQKAVDPNRYLNPRVPFTGGRRISDLSWFFDKQLLPNGFNKRYLWRGAAGAVATSGLAVAACEVIPNAQGGFQTPTPNKQPTPSGTQINKQPTVAATPDILTQMSKNADVKAILSNPNKNTDPADYNNRINVIDKMTINVNNGVSSAAALGSDYIKNAQLGFNKSSAVDRLGTGFALVGVDAGIITSNNVGYQVLLIPLNANNPHGEWVAVITRPDNARVRSVQYTGISNLSNPVPASVLYGSSIGKEISEQFITTSANDKYFAYQASDDEIAANKAFQAWLENPNGVVAQPQFVIRGSQFDNTQVPNNALKYAKLAAYQ